MRNYKLEWMSGLTPLDEALAEVRNKINEDYTEETLDDLADYIGQYKSLMNYAAQRYLCEHGYVQAVDDGGKKKWVKLDPNNGSLKTSKYESEEKDADR